MEKEMIFNKYEQEEYDSYTKEQIYKAFLTENLAKLTLQEQLKRADRNIAALRYDRNKFEEKYFRELVKRTIPYTTDEDLDTFFKSSHQIVWLKNGGYVGIQFIDDMIIFALAYTGGNFGDMREIKRIFKGKTIYYDNETGVDFFHNHSVQCDFAKKLML